MLFDKKSSKMIKLCPSLMTVDWLCRFCTKYNVSLVLLLSRNNVFLRDNWREKNRPFTPFQLTMNR